MSDEGTEDDVFGTDLEVEEEEDIYAPAEEAAADAGVVVAQADPDAVSHAAPPTPPSCRTPPQR